MPYRTQPEKKTVKKRIVLTRGEVSCIVRDHLQKTGDLPEMAPPGGFKPWMQTLDVPGVEMENTEAPWGEWPGMYFEWEEEVPDDESAPVTSSNDQGM